MSIGTTSNNFKVMGNTDVETVNVCGHCIAEPETLVNTAWKTLLPDNTFIVTVHDTEFVTPEHDIEEGEHVLHVKSTLYSQLAFPVNDA